MNGTLRIVLAFAVIIYFAIIFNLLKRRKLSLKYTLLWLASGIVMILILVFPNVFAKIVNMMGIIEVTNGVFSVVIFALIIISMSITSIVSKLNDQIRQLVQQCAMYEKRIRELEKTMK